MQVISRGSNGKCARSLFILLQALQSIEGFFAKGENENNLPRVLTKRRTPQNLCLFFKHFRQFLSQNFSMLTICYQPQSFRHQKNASNYPRVPQKYNPNPLFFVRDGFGLFFSTDLRIRSSAVVRFRLLRR